MNCELVVFTMSALLMAACGSTESAVQPTDLPTESGNRSDELSPCEACLASGRTWQPGECTDDCDIADTSCFRDACPGPCEPGSCDNCFTETECEAAACTWEDGEYASCHARPAPQGYSRISFAGAAATPAERAQCESVGGTVRPGGLAQHEICEQRFPDAAQHCSSSSECMGRCVFLGQNAPAVGAAATGTCEATDVGFGCTTLVENGVIESTLCID